MSDEQRQRLATVAATGYPGALLAAIAQAALPGYQTGERLDEQQLSQVADAVELLEEARLSAEQAGAVIAVCRERAPERWREHFWALAVKAAMASARARATAGSSQVS
jgi:hypothetical protein